MDPLTFHGNVWRNGKTGSTLVVVPNAFVVSNLVKPGKRYTFTITAEVTEDEQ